MLKGKPSFLQDIHVVNCIFECHILGNMASSYSTGTGTAKKPSNLNMARMSACLGLPVALPVGIVLIVSKYRKVPGLVICYIAIEHHHRN
jgi:hypothetical protein